MKTIFVISMTFIIAGIAGSIGAYAQDIEKGKDLFGRLCLACHYNPNEDKNWFGPSLHGVVNRQSAGYQYAFYSTAMRNLKVVWTEENLDKFIKNPDSMVPGTKMDCVGVNASNDRADIIAYLKENSK